MRSNMNGSGRSRRSEQEWARQENEIKHEWDSRSRRSEHGWVRQEQEIRTWMDQAGVGDVLHSVQCIKGRLGRQIYKRNNWTVLEPCCLEGFVWGGGGLVKNNLNMKESPSPSLPPPSHLHNLAKIAWIEKESLNNIDLSSLIALKRRR
jgi:hypothetical protein